jgi:hypothetical protein
MQGLPQSVAGIDVEDRLNLGRGPSERSTRARRQDTGINTPAAPFLHGQLKKIERIGDDLIRTADVQATDNRMAPSTAC